MNNVEKFNDFKKLLDHMFTLKKKEKNESDAYWLSNFPEYAIKHYYFTDSDVKPTFETSNDEGGTWHFYSMIEHIIEHIDVEYLGCKHLGNGTAQLDFCALGYPYGGITGLTMLLKSFGFKAIEIDEGGGFYEVHWKNDSEFELSAIKNDMDSIEEKNTAPIKINYLIFGISLLIFIGLFTGFGIKLMVGISNALLPITNYFFAFSSSNLDYLLLSLIPVYGMLFNSTRAQFKLGQLIMDITTILFWVTIMFGIGLNVLTFIGKPENPLMPQYIRTEPFDYYITIFIGSGIAIPFLILKIIKKQTQ